MKRAAALLFLAFLAVPRVFAAASEDVGEEIEKPINLWPIVYEERGRDKVEFEVLFSLIYYDQNRDKLSLGFRPFYSQSSEPSAGKRSWSVLWPVAVYHRENDVRKLHILPLFWQKLSSPDSYSIFLPLFNYRRDADGRSVGLIGYSPYSLFDFSKDYRTGAVSDRFLLVVYSREGDVTSFSVMPLYNQTHAPERGEEALFPIFHHAWDRPAGYSQFSLLGFPATYNVFEVENDDRRESWKWHLLLAWWETSPDKTLRMFAPLYWTWSEPDNDFWLLWPFWGKSEKDSNTERSVLWPFFRWSEDPIQDDSEVNLVYPLFQYHRNPELNHDRLLPLYAWTRVEASTEPTSGLPWGLYSPIPLFYRQTGPSFSYNRFFYLAWLTRNGDARHDFVLDYYNIQPDSSTRHVGLFPFWHRSRWDDKRLDLAPLYVDYERPDLRMQTAFPIYWNYRSDSVRLRAGLPFYYEFHGSSYAFTTVFPFYYHSTDAVFGSELTYYFPLYGTYRRGATETRHLLLFPLWSHTSDPAIALSAWDVAWPFFHYETAPDRGSVRVLPLFWSRRSPEGEFAFGFPLYWHYASAESSQTHFLPFYGRYSRDGFGLRYILGPAFIEMTGREYHRVDVLASLYGWKRDGDEERSHFFPLYWAWNSPGYGQRLFFPLFGTERAAPTYSSLYFLGVQPQASVFEFTRDPDNQYSLTRFLNVYFRRDRQNEFGTVFPLYWQWRDGTAKDSLLFPLYGIHTDSATGAYDFTFLGLTGGLGLIEASREGSSDESSERVLLYYHRRVAERNLRTVVPLFWQWWDDDSSESYLFPLFSAASEPGDRAWGLLGVTPTISLFSTEREGRSRRSARLFPLFGVRSSSETYDLSLIGAWYGVSLFYLQSSSDSVRHRFFPLYAYDRSGRPGTEGYQRHASVLWRVVYDEREGAEREFRLLFRLVRLHSEPGESATEVNPFYFKITKRSSSYWAVLGGLFGVETRADGSKRFRYLWFL